MHTVILRRLNTHCTVFMMIFAWVVEYSIFMSHNQCSCNSCWGYEGLDYSVEILSKMSLNVSVKLKICWKSKSKVTY